MKTESKIYTQRELELAHILTMEYELNLEPGTYEAILDLKAMTRANVLRVFLLFCLHLLYHRSGATSWHYSSF